MPRYARDPRDLTARVAARRCLAASREYAPAGSRFGAEFKGPVLDKRRGALFIDKIIS